MTTPNPHLAESFPVQVIARSLSAAAEIAEVLRGAGLPVQSGTDLDLALARGPRVVVLDPEGWETTCRHTLDLLPDTAPPPALVFTSSDRIVLHTAGPAFGFVPRDAPAREFASLIKQAERAWRRYAALCSTGTKSPPPADLRRIQDLVQQKTGTEIRADRRIAFAQTVRRRMRARLLVRHRDYAELLARSRGEYDEAELLAGLLSIGETYFWRYSGQFRALQGVLVPALSGGDGHRPRGGATFRVWCAGCSTGEEAYSLAMACDAALPPGWDVQVLATDISRPALATARGGVYGLRALRNLPAALRQKHLETSANGVRVAAPLRSKVHFEFLNLVGEGAAAWVETRGPFHAIFCRNVLIYFDHGSTEQVVGLFRSSLLDGGGLFLGASETLYAKDGDLRPVRSMGSFFYRKEAPREDAQASPVVVSDAADGPLQEGYAEGLARLDAEDFSGARAAFDAILEQRPEDPRGNTGIALLLANEGREVEAGEYLRRALESEPRLAETQYLLGLVEERLGGDTAALRHYAATVGLDPGFFMAHLNRAWILQRLGRRRQFVDELRAALRILRERPKITHWATGGMGWDALFSLVVDALALEGEEE